MGRGWVPRIHDFHPPPTKVLQLRGLRFRPVEEKTESKTFPGGVRVRMVPKSIYGKIRGLSKFLRGR